jgi:hypothetical protein
VLDPAVAEVPQPQADLPDGITGGGVSDGKGVTIATGEAFMLSFDVRTGIAQVAACRDGRDERDQRITGGRLHQADVLVAEWAQHYRLVGDDRHLRRQHAAILRPFSTTARADYVPAPDAHSSAESSIGRQHRHRPR